MEVGIDWMSRDGTFWVPSLCNCMFTKISRMYTQVGLSGCVEIIFWEILKGMGGFWRNSSISQFVPNCFGLTQGVIGKDFNRGKNNIVLLPRENKLKWFCPPLRFHTPRRITKIDWCIYYPGHTQVPSSSPLSTSDFYTHEYTYTAFLKLKFLLTKFI